MSPKERGQMTKDSLDLLRPTSIVVDIPPEAPADGVADVGGASTPTPQRKMPSLHKPSLKFDRKSRTSSGPTLVGLDIQPGYVTAVQARVNGSVLVQRAAGAPLPPDTVREGEVLDGVALAETLREMFGDSRLDKRVRVGVANQRTVLRTLEMPPLTDGKELDAAIRFQAEDQIPMPLENAVLDYHLLGVSETPAGPRQRVIVVAAQRDMLERLLSAVREAGLRPEGVDLSAFALIRSLHRVDDQHAGRVLYLNIGGLTNMAIAEGNVCHFTRVVSGGLESMATDIAERHGIALLKARSLLASVNLEADNSGAPPYGAADAQAALDPESFATPSEPYETPAEPSPDPVETPSIDVRPVLAGGVREIAGEVRNSLDFHRSQDGGGEVSRVILSGPALRIAGFARALQSELGVPVVPQTVGLVSDGSAGSVSPEHLAVATGLATEEAPR
ncbi:MAG TPA: type IV pilus assembly protein PilM [Solirubrobacteraceae bacterium]|nr:type IV pilus assembly protein PilM [Solirubrobacteraceae bacterium]